MADFQIFKISFLGEVLEEHYEVKQKAEKNFSEKGKPVVGGFPRLKEYDHE